jgi:hypothetical protein
VLLDAESDARLRFVAASSDDAARDLLAAVG